MEFVFDSNPCQHPEWVALTTYFGGCPAAALKADAVNAQISAANEIASQEAWMRYRNLEAVPYGREEATLHRQVEVLDENVWIVVEETNDDGNDEE